MIIWPIFSLLFFSFFSYSHSEATSITLSRKVHKLHHLVQKNRFLQSSSNQENEKIKEISLINYKNVQYFGTLMIGSSKQEFNIMFDTSSHTLVIPSTKCQKNCRKFTNKYDFSLSESFQNLTVPMTVESNNANFSGYLSTDNLYINPATEIKNFVFLLYENETLNTNLISDGIIGLGVNYQNEKESLLMKMFNQGYIKYPVFSFYLSDSSRDSVLYFDDQSTNPNFAGIYKRMNYCEVVNKSADSWECNLNNLSIGGGENSTFNINKKVVFETGTSYILVPKADYNQMKHSIIGNSVCILSNFNQLVCKCKSHNTFSNMNLSLNNGSLFLESKTFIEFEPYQEYQCKFQILVDDTIDYWVLGDAALRGLYITFDYQRKRIGFAKNYFLEESTAVERDDEDVKIYYLVALILIGVAMFGLFRWANTQNERENIEKRDVFLDKNKMINLQEK